MAEQSDYLPLGGKSRQFRHKETGAIISRRQFDKLRGISYERKAEFSRARNAELFYLRPAKGRTSQTKLSGEIRGEVAAIRREATDARLRVESQEKAVRRLERETVRKANKRVKQKQIRAQLLKPGAMGARVSFVSYDGYLKALQEMRSLKVTVGGKREAGVVGYAVGVVGYDDRKGESKMLGATIFRMRDPDAKAIPESELLERTEDFINEHSYFVFLHWFIHVAFNAAYAREKRARKNGGLLR